MTTELSPEWRTRAEAFLHQCGPCDAGLPMGCVCSTDDPRPVIAHLLDVIDTARGGVSVTDQTPTNTLTDSHQEAVDRASRVFGWQHLARYSGQTDEWLAATLGAIVLAARGNNTTHETVDAFDHCDRGVCNAERGHNGTCEQASGWRRAEDASLLASLRARLDNVSDLAKSRDDPALHEALNGYTRSELKCEGRTPADCGNPLCPAHNALRAALSPTPTNNQHHNDLADRVRALADKWIASGDERRYVYDLGRQLRAVVDGPTTPTQETP